MIEQFSPLNMYLWDTWFIRHKNVNHIFYLQSMKVEDPEERHNISFIGHARSKDFITWEELPMALRPGKKGSWDDLSLWTGSVLKHNNQFYLFYTGRKNKRDERNIQKIGVAYSKDLIHWEKEEKNPLIEVDERYYDVSNKKNKLGKITAWRDPFVFKDPASKKFYMTISARTKGKQKEYNGCIALAESTDLLNWKVLPPIYAPGIFDEIEVSHIIFKDGYYYLFFSIPFNKGVRPDFLEKHHLYNGGFFCYYSKNLFKGYKPVNKNGIVINDSEKVYALRVIKQSKEKYITMGWLNLDDEKKFQGKISYPYNLHINKDKITVTKRKISWKKILSQTL